MSGVIVADAGGLHQPEDDEHHHELRELDADVEREQARHHALPSRVETRGEAQAVDHAEACSEREARSERGPRLGCDVRGEYDHERDGDQRGGSGYEAEEHGEHRRDVARVPARRNAADILGGHPDNGRGDEHLDGAAVDVDPAERRERERQAVAEGEPGHHERGVTEPGGEEHQEQHEEHVVPAGDGVLETVAEICRGRRDRRGR